MTLPVDQKKILSDEQYYMEPSPMLAMLEEWSATGLVSIYHVILDQFTMSYPRSQQFKKSPFDIFVMDKCDEACV